MRLIGYILPEDGWFPMTDAAPNSTLPSKPRAFGVPEAEIPSTWTDGEIFRLFNSLVEAQISAAECRQANSRMRIAN